MRNSMGLAVNDEARITLDFFEALLVAIRRLVDVSEC